MSRVLKSLALRKVFKLFGMRRGSKKVNHLSLADNMIILCKADLVTMQGVSSTLERYEKISWQKVNKVKSAVYLYKGVSQGVVVIAEVAKGILRKEFPFIYLGCPIFHMRKKKDFYQTIMNIINTKLQGWKEKMLSYGGRAVLIKHALQSIPIHCLSVMNSPGNVMNLI